jgi:uncharacterized protein YkwD
VVAMAASTGAARAMDRAAVAKSPWPRRACSPDELRFVALINAERRSRGVAPLTVDPLLVAVARAHSREMSRKRYFSHWSPTPALRTPDQRYQAAYRKRFGGSFTRPFLLGENLFSGSFPDVEIGHQALMASPSHRYNVLDEQFNEVGIGTFVNASGEYYVTQVFLRRRR